MTLGTFSRRTFLGRSALALGAASVPFDLMAQTTLMVRPEWQTFKTTSHYDALLKALRLMKGNTNPADPNSWSYWSNIHVTKCPHSVPYFLAWHRGYLVHFERRLRAVSGDKALVLPYWNYYASPNLPAEFTNPNNGNPLYVERVNTNVASALSMDPFASKLTNFQRGMENAFETSIEDRPHNPVHDVIGGIMASMDSPLDPIFWLHHANIDRLWVAWCAAGGGRKMPAQTNAYWAGTHEYTSTLTLPRPHTYSTRTNLVYRYDNENLPTRLPAAQAGSPSVLQMEASDELPGSIPAVGSFPLSGPRQTGRRTFSIAGALAVGLDERSVSVQLPAGSEHARALARMASGNAASFPGRAEQFRSVELVLDNVELGEAARLGGYFYQLYLNIPSAKGKASRFRSIYIGTLGSFRINAAMHHSGAQAQLRYPIRRHLAGALERELGMISVSFVRVDGERSPKGELIGMGEVRMEVSTDDGD
jgi:tyrosinase